MKTQPLNHDNKISEDQLVEEYFAAIRERQQIEKEYYQTRDPEVLAKLKTAKERIIEVKQLMGIIKKSIPSWN